MARGGIALALLVAACAAPPAPDPWKLWTIDALEARHDPAVVEPGAALTLLQSPYPAVGAKTGLQQASRRGLTVFPAFSEGKPAAYMTTEVWQNFDEVWVQPLYVDVTRKNPPIFGVDASTRFYSPYWQIFTYSHPTGAPEFRSAKDVLDAQVLLAPNSAKFCAITRDSTLGAALQQGDSAPIRPLNGDPVTAPRNGTAYADGNDVSFIDLGNAQRFTFDPATLIVDETPLFAFALPDAGGFPAQVDLPKVGGTGPPHHPRCDGHAHAPDGVSPCPGVFGETAVLSGIPEFGSLWRVYDVLLPAAADVYVPANLPLLQDQVKAMGFAATQTPAPLSSDFILRVAVNGKTCLASDPSTCIWLDSQNQIESQVVDWRITKTGTLVTCPLVEFNGKPVPFR
jgi:hypothetical protein